MKTAVSMISVCTIVLVSGCATVPEGPESQAVLSAEVSEAITAFKTQDPTMQSFFDNSYGYAVLPKVTKGKRIVCFKPTVWPPLAPSSRRQPPLTWAPLPMETFSIKTDEAKNPPFNSTCGPIWQSTTVTGDSYPSFAPEETMVFPP